MADTFSISLERLDGYRFRADFGDGIAPLLVDEGPPLGRNAGPNPSRLLATALADCLSASLVFCLGRSRIEPRALKTTATGTLVRNEKKRLRIGRIDVVLTVELAPDDLEKARACLGLFEDFCVVTASVRAGLPVGVRVESPGGELLHASG